MERAPLSIRMLLFASGFTFLNVVDRLAGGGLVTPPVVALSLVGGFILALPLAWVLPRMGLRRLDLVAATWLFLFIIFSLNNLIEAYFFTDVFPSASIFAGAAAISLLTSLGDAALAGFLFPPAARGGGIASRLRGLLGERTKASWAWRVAASSTLYLPIYLVFGAMISPFVLPYYAEGSLGLRLPPIAAVIPLELLRGFLYVVALLPVFASLEGGRRAQSAAAAALLYIPGGLVPLIIQPSLPAPVVPFHMVEILADSIVYGWIITRLIGVEKEAGASGPSRRRRADGVGVQAVTGPPRGASSSERRITRADTRMASC